jgi:hypothetical protein
MKQPNTKVEEQAIRTILSARAKNLLLPNKIIKDKIAEATNTSYSTVHRWIQDDSPLITQADAMRVIREYTGLTDEQILSTPEKHA